MGNVFKNALIVFVVFVFIAGVFALARSPFEKIEKLTLSEVAALVNEGKISSIEVKNNKLEIILGDETKAISNKEKEASLSETLLNYGVNSTKLALVKVNVSEPSGAAFWAGTILPILLPFLLIGFFLWFLLRQAQRGSMQALSFGQSNLRMVMPGGKDRVTFKDVAGLKEAKEELLEIVEFLRSPKKFLEIGAQIPRGVLLMGSPGTGKTLLARAVAGEAKVPFFHISGSEFVEMFVGVGASRVRDAFKTAKKHAPSIIFVDEIDAVGRQRGAGLGGGHDEREQTLNQILVEMDGFERDTQVIVIAATNRPDVLDPALLRPGRFDRRIVLDEPDIDDREEILKIHSKNKIMEQGVNLRRVAERTPGFSGADLANLVNEAAIFAARHNRKKIAQLDLFEAIEKVLLGPERKSRLLSPREKEITAYHEAGHALVAASMKHADPVHKVSIVARGRAGGFTLKLPVEDRRLHTRSEFLADLAVMLGGYASEKLTFNELTTGASNDLQRATELARQMVTRYGMSEKFGPITFHESEELVFLGRELGEHKIYSEEMAGEVDKEVRKFIDDAFQTAKKILAEKKEKLKEIADALIERETLEQEQFKAVIEGRAIPEKETRNSAPLETPEDLSESKTGKNETKPKKLAPEAQGV